MDANKRETLLQLGYQIHPACGLCSHARFSQPGDFGVCALKAYEHQKHTGAPRQLSIHRYGACSDFARPAFLGAWEEFFKADR